MNFFGQNAIAYLNRSGIDFFVRGKPKKTFEFTPETVVAEEVINKNKLEQLLTDFISSNDLAKNQSPSSCQMI